MPAPLNAKSADQNLRTVLTTARGEGQGTVFVGENAVSRRGAWSRLFKSNPTTPRGIHCQFQGAVAAYLPNIGGKD